MFHLTCTVVWCSKGDAQVAEQVESLVDSIMTR